MNYQELLNKVFESVDALYEVGEEDTANADNEKQQDAELDTEKDDASDLVGPTEENVSPMEVLRETVSEYIEVFEEHFEQYFDMLDTIQRYKEGGAIIVFPIERHFRFEILFLFKKESREGKSVKMISYIVKDRKRKITDKREFSLNELAANISTPEALFPTRRVEKILGMKLEPREQESEYDE